MYFFIPLSNFLQSQPREYAHTPACCLWAAVFSLVFHEVSVPVTFRLCRWIVQKWNVRFLIHTPHFFLTSENSPNLMECLGGDMRSVSCHQAVFFFFMYFFMVSIWQLLNGGLRDIHLSCLIRDYKWVFSKYFIKTRFQVIEKILI